MIYYKHAKSKHLPSKLIRLNKYKHKKSSWITYVIIHLIKYRDELYKKANDRLILHRI